MKRDDTVARPRRTRPRSRALGTLVSAVVALAVLTAGCTPGAGESPTDPPSSVKGTSEAAAYDSATRDDAEFNRLFTHQFADVEGVRMHYVTGGTGEPLVLLHGWPQSWYEWRGIMPDLAERYTVYAVDLPGLGDSEGAPTSYDKKTLAQYVHGLVTQLGLDDIRMVAHDLGAGVGFQYAAQYPSEITRYAHLDYSLPGPGLPTAELRSYSWHLAFHTQEKVPETVVDDDVREYLALFYPQVAYGGSSFGGTRTEPIFTEAQIDEFARTYNRPQVLTGGFELYRTLDKDERDNTAARPIRVPTMLMTAAGTLNAIRAQVQPRMANITRAIEVPRAGHWLPEENPQFVTAELLRFLAS